MANGSGGFDSSCELFDLRVEAIDFTEEEFKVSGDVKASGDPPTPPPKPFKLTGGVAGSVATAAGGLVSSPSCSYEKTSSLVVGNGPVCLGILPSRSGTAASAK